MFIIGNCFHQGNHNYVIVISTDHFPEYPPHKQTRLTSDNIVYQYKIDVTDKNRICLGENQIYIPDELPKSANTTLYFVSCDGQNAKAYNYSSPVKIYGGYEDDDMWKKLYYDIRTDTNPYKFVIHIGDQVYMDDAHNSLIANGYTTNRHEITRAYYNEYKQNFGKKYKQKVLASAFNVMVCDDHDIVDNYGSVPNNLTREMLRSVKLFYKTFQEDLYGIKRHRIKHLLFSDFQIIIPDLRSYRKPTTNSSARFPIMGDKQMAELRRITDNQHPQIKQTYFVNSAPLVGVNSTLSSIVGFIARGKTDYILDYYIASPSYERERDYVLNKLLCMKGSVTIVCGDYHAADCYSLTRNKKCIRQITTSPISSDPLSHPNNPYYKRLLEPFFSSIYDKQIDDIRIDKQWYVYDYNYLKIANCQYTIYCYGRGASLMFNSSATRTADFVK